MTRLLSNLMTFAVVAALWLFFGGVLFDGLIGMTKHAVGPKAFEAFMYAGMPFDLQISKTSILKYYFWPSLLSIVIKTVLLIPILLMAKHLYSGKVEPKS